MKYGEFKGITEKTLSDGSKNYYVRFKYLGKVYPVKNFSKLYGCSSKKKTYEKLQEVKALIRSNQDPFLNITKDLNYYFYKFSKLKIDSGDWRKSTLEQYTYFYETIIKKDLGWKKLGKIQYSDLEIMMNKISDKSGSYKNKIRRILFPIFEGAIKRKEIAENPCLGLEFYQMERKEKLETRVKHNKLKVIRILYKAFKEHKSRYMYQREEINIFFLLCLMTGHRYGELLQLTKDDCHIDKKYIISQRDITKTKNEYKFPIPKECIEYIENVEDGLLFPNLKYGSLYYQFRNILNQTDIELHKNKRISPHDMRSLMLNIMIQKCDIDSMLADACLEHKQPKVIEHYLNFTYKNKKKAFKKYWKLVRNMNNKK